jgi:hypothetical protein
VRVVGLIITITALIAMLFDYYMGIILFGISLLFFGISNLKRKNKPIAYVYLSSAVVFIVGSSIRDLF